MHVRQKMNEKGLADSLLTFSSPFWQRFFHIFLASSLESFADQKRQAADDNDRLYEIHSPEKVQFSGDLFKLLFKLIHSSFPPYDLVNLGYALVNPTEPVQEAYATETGCRALVMEKEVHRQRAEQKADQERDNISNRRAANRDGWSNVVSAVIGAVVGAVAMWVLERFF